jgi:hypothetical protein
MKFFHNKGNARLKFALQKFHQIHHINMNQAVAHKTIMSLCPKAKS